jgi:hypothetical protein
MDSSLLIMLNQRKLTDLCKVNKREVPLKENGEYQAWCLKVIISDQLCDSWILVGDVC